MKRGLLFSLLLATSLCNIHAGFFSWLKSPDISPKAQTLITGLNNIGNSDKTQTECLRDIKNDFNNTTLFQLDGKDDEIAIQHAAKKAKQRITAQSTFTPIQATQYWLKNILTNRLFCVTVLLGFTTGYAFKNGHIIQNMATPYINQENAKLLTTALPLTLAVATGFGAANVAKTGYYTTLKTYENFQLNKKHSAVKEQMANSTNIEIDIAVQKLYPSSMEKVD